MSDTEQAVTPEIEEQAKGMGWVPQEDFKGDEAKWVDAQTFVEKGEHVLPIIKATNKRLRDDLTKMNTQLGETNRALQQSQETIAALEKYHQEDVKQKVEKARAELKRQLVTAKKEGDTEAEVDLTDELTKLNAAEKVASDAEAATATTKKGNGQTRPPVDYTQDPIFLQWKEDNPWFGVDQAKSAIAQMITVRLRASGNTEVGRPFLDKVSAETSKELVRLGAGGGRGTSKVEGSKGGSTSGNGGSRSYSALPQEAKAACDGFNSSLVGKGRRYESVDAWRKAYAEQYFREV